MIRALLWDVDGTLAETERDGHRIAFNRAFEACGLAWRWDVERYGELLRVTGGRERLLHDMASRADAPALPDERQALAAQLHQRKNSYYAELVGQGGIALRPGVLELMNECRARGVRMGIATTTSRANVAALLAQQLGRDSLAWFDTVVCGEDVQRKKPDPEVYTLALRELGIGALEAIAIEDSPGGAAAAQQAGVPVVVTRSAYFAADSVEGAIAIGPGLHRRIGWVPRPDAGVSAEPPTRERIGLDDLIEWHARMDIVSQHG
jgi:HAD superfamily hydrolase (TIGR01509 family)